MTTAERDTKPEIEQPPDVLTLAEAAAFLRCSVEKARRMVAAGQIPAFRLGPGPRAEIRIYRWALVRASENNFKRTSQPDRAREAEAKIARLFEADGTRRRK